MDPKTTTIKVEMDHLLRITAAVQLHASKDDTLPVLNGLHFYLAEGKLVAEATDRYRLARAMAPAEILDTGAGPAAHLRLADVANLIRELKHLAKAWQGPLTLSWTTDGRFTMATGDLPRFGADMDDHLASSFPKVSAILEAAADAALVEGDRVIKVNPAYLEDFWRGIKAAIPARLRRNAGLTVSPNGKKPALVTYEDWFAGVIMPLRIEGEEDAAAEVAGRLAGMAPMVIREEVTTAAA